MMIDLSSEIQLWLGIFDQKKLIINQQTIDKL
jgi:hypothetical protein